MTSNYFILNRSTLSLLLAISLPITLVGCQSNPSRNSTMTANSVLTAPVISQKVVQTQVPTVKQENIVMGNKVTEVIEATSETGTEAPTLQWASNYNWKLMQVKDKKNNPININTDVPITLAVAPSSLSLTQGCQHLAIKFVWMSEPPFKYGSRLGEKRSTCKNVLEDIKNETDIKALFPRDSTFKLGIEALPLSMNEPINTQNVPKNLVVTIENGNTLMFTGKPIAFKKPTGLPIDKALLERYDWQLKSAVRNISDDNGKIISRQPIGDFYHPAFPVSLQFIGYGDSQYAFFSSSCNGVGGPYILMKDHTLLVGSGPQTLMGCGVTGNRIENELSKLVSNSKSTLSLSLLPSSSSEAQSTNQTYFPRYNLLQTFDSGETLVWQNTIKKTP